MFLSLQARPEADMADFFMYENLQFSPPLSNKGKFKQGAKSGISDCIPENRSARSNSERNGASVIVLDMPAVIHMIKPHKAETFGDYITQHLLAFLHVQMNESTTRIDAVWNRYLEQSLKNQARAKRLRTAKKRGNNSIR